MSLGDLTRGRYIVRVLTGNTISEFEVLVVVGKMVFFHFFHILRKFGMM